MLKIKEKLFAKNIENIEKLFKSINQFNHPNQSIIVLVKCCLTSSIVN